MFAKKQQQKKSLNNLHFSARNMPSYMFITRGENDLGQLLI